MFKNEVSDIAKQALLDFMSYFGCYFFGFVEEFTWDYAMSYLVHAGHHFKPTPWCRENGHFGYEGFAAVRVKGCWEFLLEDRAAIPPQSDVILQVLLQSGSVHEQELHNCFYIAVNPLASIS